MTTVALAYCEVLPDEQGPTAAAFWGRAQAFFAAHLLGPPVMGAPDIADLVDPYSLDTAKPASGGGRRRTSVDR